MLKQYVTFYVCGPGCNMKTYLPVRASEVGQDRADDQRILEKAISKNRVLITLDAHAGQQNAHNRLVEQLAGGLAALRSVLNELNKWDSTLVMTYSEFGRRPNENMSFGTDHGTANVHFMMGGKVKGGLFGRYPSLSNLDNGNLKHNIDFRSMYATAIEKWWGLDSYSVLGSSFPAINII